MMDIQSAKKQLRKRMAALRDGLPPDDRERRSLAICRRTAALLEDAGIGTGKAVLVYVPFRSEVNTWPLIRALWERHQPVAAPRTNRAAGTLAPYRFDREEQLIPGAYQIPEPDPARCERLEPAHIGAVVVPGLAFDRRGARLGYGTGYYDRLFRGIRAGGQPMPLRIGVAFGSQLADKVPMDDGDVPVDRVVTEDAVFCADGPRS